MKLKFSNSFCFSGPPLVAILDEPTTGVDPNARQQMQEIFLNAIKSKLTIILTSHSMDEWYQKKTKIRIFNFIFFLF
jgi:ABC-2 type transport system ATP-binding protein